MSSRESSKYITINDGEDTYAIPAYKEAPTPDPVVIMNGDGKELIRIHKDGTVTGAVEDASEAGRIFIQSLRDHFGRGV